MGPIAEDNPTVLHKFLISAGVPLPVTFDFGNPECAIRARWTEVRWASVPEAAVYEDSDLLLGEEDVR